MDEFSSDDEDLRQKAFVVDQYYVDEEGENDALPPTSGHDYLRRVIKEAKKEPAIVVANISNYNFKNAYKVPSILKSHVDVAPLDFMPDLKWQTRQEAEFSKIRQKLVNYKAQFLKSYKEDNLQLPPINNFNAWLRFCLGEVCLSNYQTQLKPWLDPDNSSSGSDSETIDVNKSLKSDSSQDSIRSNDGDSENIDVRMNSVLSCENLVEMEQQRRGDFLLAETRGAQNDGIDLKFDEPLTIVHPSKQLSNIGINSKQPLGNAAVCDLLNEKEHRCQDNWKDFKDTSSKVDYHCNLKTHTHVMDSDFNEPSNTKCTQVSNSSNLTNFADVLSHRVLTATCCNSNFPEICSSSENCNGVCDNAQIKSAELLNRDVKFTSECYSAERNFSDENKIINGQVESGAREMISSENLAKGNVPMLNIVCRINQPTIVKLLNYFLEWMQKIHFTIFQGQWIYALLACLEKPLEPETCSILRSLVLFFRSIRCKLKNQNDVILGSINLLICIIGRYFGQLDLADQPTT